MNNNDRMRQLLEWLLQELEGEIARIQKEKAAQEDFLLDLIDEIQQLLG